jgi:hypothetical protein
VTLDNIIAQSPKPCPCKNCGRRYVDTENHRTCHCDCKEYKDWAEENRQRHDAAQKAMMIEIGLRDYEIRRANQIRKRTRRSEII